MYRSFSLMIVGLVSTIAVSTYIYKKKNTTTVYAYSCALVVPAEHAAMDEIIHGFTETVNSAGVPIECVVYNGQGNKTLLHSQIEKVLHDNVDVVCTIGLTASQLTSELLKKRNSVNKTKHIFVAVDEPVQKGLIDSLQKPTGNTTGVISIDSLSKQIESLKKLKPLVKHILLVYDPSHPSNNKDKKELAKICALHNIQLSDIAITQTNELAQKIPVMLNDIDTVLVLKDHLIVTGLDILIKLCVANNITLYCSDLNSVQKGAALAFGVYEYDYGKHAGLIAIEMLINKKNISQLPVYTIQNQHLLINKRTALLQGLSFADNQLEQYKKEGVIIYES